MPPRYVKTWQAPVGYMGKPWRVIQGLSHKEAPLLREIYLAGGPGWDDDSEPGDFLVLEVQATQRPQSSANYNKFFEEYQGPGAYDAEVLKIDGGDRAMWGIHVNYRYPKG